MQVSSCRGALSVQRRAWCAEAWIAGVALNALPSTLYALALDAQRLPATGGGLLRFLIAFHPLDVHVAHPGQLDGIVRRADDFFPRDFARHVELVQCVVH